MTLFQSAFTSPETPPSGGEDSDENWKDDQPPKGPPLPNTLEATLQIHPLCYPYKPMKVPEHPRVKEETEEDELKIAEEILQPDDEAVLTNAIQRLDMEPPPTKRKLISSSSDDWKKRLAQMLAEKKTKNGRSFTKAPNRQFLLKRFRKSPTAPLLSPLPQRVTYMTPNSFGIRMVSPYKLYPYQAENVQWMIDVEEGRITHPCYEPGIHGCLLALPMGYGKTCCVGSLVMYSLKQQRKQGSATLYICPKTLLGTVRTELEKFFGDQLRILTFHKDFLRDHYNVLSSAHIRNYDIILTNYNTIAGRNWSAHQGIVAAQEFCSFPWFRIVIDESHEIRNAATERNKAIHQLVSSRRIAMTGTIIVNEISDLFNQMIFTGYRLPPNTRKDEATFKETNLMKMVRFVRRENIPDIQLPPKHIHTIYFNLSEKERYLHDYIAEMAQKILQQAKEIKEEDDISDTKHDRRQFSWKVRFSLARAMQICSAPYLITPAAKEEVSKEDTVNLAKAPDIQVLGEQSWREWVHERMGEAGIYSSKLKTLVELWKTLREQATAAHPLKVVVFANQVCMLRLTIAAMEHAFPDFKDRHVFVHGGIFSVRRREDLFTHFRLNKQVEALFMTTGLGSIGLNLSEADKVIFLEPWYTYAMLHQAESRVHRINQIHPVHVYYLLAKDSAEERAYQIAQEKKELAESLTRPRTGMKEMKFILGNKSIPDEAVDMEVDDDDDLFWQF